jgi:TPR repeat protein
VGDAEEENVRRRRETNRRGLELEGAGDLAGAEAAFREADAAGSPGGAANLGLLLVKRRDASGAIVAFRRAMERGSARGALALGLTLGDRGGRAQIAAGLSAARSAALSTMSRGGDVFLEEALTLPKARDQVQRPVLQRASLRTHMRG